MIFKLYGIIVFKYWIYSSSIEVIWTNLFSTLFITTVNDFMMAGSIMFLQF